VSRSWTETLRKDRRSGVSAGLEIGCGVVRYVEVESKAGRRHVRATKSVRLEKPVFASDPTPEIQRAMTGAIAEAAESACNRYVPLHISIPDPLVRTVVYELDELPGNQAARLALAQFRLQRDLPAQEYEYRTEALGVGANGKHLLLCVAMSRSWHRALSECMQALGIVPWSLAGRLPCLLNASAGDLPAASSVLVAANDDSWGLAALDVQGRLRYVRAQWRTPELTAAAIASEVQRSILAYVHQDASRSVESIRLLATGAERGDLAQELNARSSDACQLIGTADLGVDVSDDASQAEYSAAIAAALR
jgi:Tfp pilus assembly PilM family ATPase